MIKINLQARTKLVLQANFACPKSRVAISFFVKFSLTQVTIYRDKLDLQALARPIALTAARNLPGWTREIRSMASKANPMKPNRRYAVMKSQEGAVAVEAAICMTFILLPLFALIFVFGNFFWYYTAAQKSVHDAALYMSGAPLAEIKSSAAEGLARDIQQQETADFRRNTTMESSIECGYQIGNSAFVLYSRCNSTNTPVGVQAMTSLTVPQPFFFNIMGRSSINIIVFSQMPYVGR